jgi:hypothetical protein
MNQSNDTSRVDPALAAGNRKNAAGYQAGHFGAVADRVATVRLNRPRRSAC